MNDFETTAKEMEALDDEFRTHGIPERFKERWNVSHNVGVWNVGRKTAELLHSLVLEKKPKLILELGTSIGYSTIWLAKAAKEIGARIVTVEIEDYKIETAKEFIAKAGVDDVIEHRHGDIGKVLASWSDPVDFVFIDANKRSYHEYVKQLEPYLTDDATIVADNITDMAEAVTEYVEYMNHHGDFDTELREIDHGVMISTKKSRS